MDPGRRVLRRLTISDVTAAESTFELLMGNDVAPRKQFIVDSRAASTDRRIDA
jgi:DNA gyrase subunit B